MISWLIVRFLKQQDQDCHMRPPNTHGATKSFGFHVLSSLCLLATFLLADLIYGQAPPTPVRSFRDRVTDRVTLSDGTHLWGMVQSTKPLRLLIRASWLQSAVPEFWTNSVLPELNQNEDPALMALAAALQMEIEQIPATMPESRQRIGLLKEIHQRLTQQNDEWPEFIVLELPKTRTRGMEAQPAARRELCRLGILNGIPDIEETHWKSVAEQLQKIPLAARKVDAPNPQQDVNKNVQRILAAVDLRLNTATRLVQQGKNVFDESAQPDLATLMNSMLGANTESLLEELLGEGSRPVPAAGNTDSLSNAARVLADSKGHVTVVVTAFDFDPAAGSATVTRRMFRKRPDAQWDLLVTVTRASTTADLKPGQIEAISNDPQIKEISGLVEGLGLGGAQFSNALQLGAVVRNAMFAADQAFEQEIQGTITARTLASARNALVISLPEKVDPKVAR